MELKNEQIKTIKTQYVNPLCKIEKATSGSFGYDVRANITESIVIKPGQVAKVPLGFKVDTGRDTLGMLLFNRSGNALKHGIQIMNGVGVIDSDYRGEVAAILYNTGATGQDFLIEPLDRVGQAVFINSLLIDEEGVELDETDRGDGGFQSTGVK